MFQKKKKEQSGAAEPADGDRNTEGPSQPVKDIRQEAPFSAAALQSIPEAERGGPHAHLEDGRAVALGPHLLMVLRDHQVVDSGFWHEVQYASWDASTRQLSIVWVHPDREPLVATTKSDNPQKFMEALTFRVNDTIVASRTFTTSGGANVAVTVRRRVDGHLFSSVVTSAPISTDDEQKALELERELRAELNMDG